MRKGIHPEYVECRVVCSCGNTFMTRSTKSELHVELCNKCHPFYTGQQKFVDTGGRVQRFADKFGDAAAAVLEREAAEREARRKAAEEAALKLRAEREARRKAAEEAALKLRAEREAKAAEKANRAAKFEVDQAVTSGEVGEEQAE